MPTRGRYSRLNSSTVCGVPQPRYKSYINSPWIYNFEDMMHILLILLSFVFTKNFQWILWIVYPNLFICLVATTIFILNGIDREKCGIHIIILIPFWILAVSFTILLYVIALFLFPFRCSRLLIYDFGMEQFAFCHQYQDTILKYLFDTKNTTKELTLSILAINYYLLSLYNKEENEMDIKTEQNFKLVQFIARRNNDGLTLENMTWSDIRKMSNDKTIFHLLFALGINFSVIIYRAYHMILLLYVWIYYYYIKLEPEWRLNATFWVILLLIITHFILKLVVICRSFTEMYICYVMFHILVPTQWVPVFLLTTNELIQNYEWIDIIQVIDEIFNCSIYQKYELSNRKDINQDLSNLILEFSTYPLPIDGDINEIYNILCRYLMLDDTHQKPLETV